MLSENLLLGHGSHELLRVRRRRAARLSGHLRLTLRIHILLRKLRRVAKQASPRVRCLRAVIVVAKLLTECGIGGPHVQILQRVRPNSLVGVLSRFELDLLLTCSDLRHMVHVPTSVLLLGYKLLLAGLRARHRQHGSVSNFFGLSVTASRRDSNPRSQMRLLLTV